jgi:tetratricopeptide (TPR) repeat protein
MPNKLTQFWQELKRRKVFKAFAMYAGAAYILIELANNVTEPLNLPEWTPRLVILIVLIGFPIVAILSWIFDITPKGIMKTESIEELSEQESGHAKSRLKTSDIIIAVLFIVVVILLYPKIFQRDKLKDIRDDDGRISIAVMPFQNMSNDTLWDIYEIGIQNELITDLSNSSDLSIRQFQTVQEILHQTNQTDFASLTPSSAGDISRKLEANSFILGSIKSAGRDIRINAHLIDAETEEIYKTFGIVGKNEDEVYALTDSLSVLLRNYLEIRVLEKDADHEVRKLATTHSAEAYRYYIQGMNMFFEQNYYSAIELYSEALKIDSNLWSAQVWQILSYMNSGRIEESRLSFQNLDKSVDKLGFTEQLYLKGLKAIFDKDQQAFIKYTELILERDPQARLAWYQQGSNYAEIHKYEKAIRYLERAIEIDNRWGGGNIASIYTLTGQVYHELGNHEREREIYESGLDALPEDSRIIHHQAVCALSQGDTTEANDYIEKYRLIRKTEDLEGYWTNYNVGLIYAEAKQYDAAIEIFRELITSHPRNIHFKWRLGSILIENDIDVDEGLGLINLILEKSPNDVNALYAKGLGYYKLGRIEEAYEFINSSWDMRSFYDHNHYILLQELKQAITN